MLKMSLRGVEGTVISCNDIVEHLLSNTTGATSGTETAYPSGELEFTSVF